MTRHISLFADMTVAGQAVILAAPEPCHLRFVILFPDYAVPLLVGSAVIYFCGPNLGTPQRGSLMGDLVPVERRRRFFALRTRLSSVATFGALISAGLVLQGFHAVGLTYWGFVAIFARDGNE